MKKIEVEAQFIFNGKISIMVEDDEDEWVAKDRITDGNIWMVAGVIGCDDDNIDYEFEVHPDLRLYEVLTPEE